MKRILVGLLCLLMILGQMDYVDAANNSTVVATHTNDQITWTLYKNGILEFKGKGELKYDGWDEYDVDIDNVIIREGITSIARSTFYGKDIRHVYVPEGLVSIGDYAFYEAWLYDLVLPSSLKHIGVAAFASGVYLKNRDMTHMEFPGQQGIVLPNGLESIGWGAFDRCNAQFIEVRKSVTNIEEEALGLWTGSVRCVKNSEAYQYAIKNNKGYTLVDNTQSYKYAYSGTCGTSAKWNYNKQTGVLTISGSGKIDDYPEKYPEWYNIRLGITEIVIEPGITSIGSYAFFEFPSLMKVTLPATLNNISSNAFLNCSKLQNIVFNGHCPQIDKNLFSDIKEQLTITCASNAMGFTGSQWQGISIIRNNNVLNIDDVVLLEKAINLYVGKTKTLQTKPMNVNLHRLLKWSSSNTTVVTVSSNSIVKGIKAGTAIITVKLPNGKKATCTVTVKNPTLSLNYTSKTLNKGSSFTLKGTPTPSATVTYKSSNPKDALKKGKLFCPKSALSGQRFLIE